MELSCSTTVLVVSVMKFQVALKLCVLLQEDQLININTAPIKVNTITIFL